MNEGANIQVLFALISQSFHPLCRPWWPFHASSRRVKARRWSESGFVLRIAFWLRLSIPRFPRDSDLQMDDPLWFRSPESRLLEKMKLNFNFTYSREVWRSAELSFWCLSKSATLFCDLVTFEYFKSIRRFWLRYIQDWLFLLNLNFFFQIILHFGQF